MADITIFWERHANASPKIPTEGVSDNDAEMRRSLTPDGVRQAYARAGTLQKKGRRFTHLLCSPAERAIQTLEYSAGVSRERFTIVDSLWATGSDGDILNKIFEEVGYAAPSVYAKHPLNLANVDKDGKGPAERFSWTCGLSIKNALFSGVSADLTVAICGHAIFTPLAAKGLHWILSGKPYSYFDEIQMPPAGVFKTTFDTLAPEIFYLEIFD